MDQGKQILIQKRDLFRWNIRLQNINKELQKQRHIVQDFNDQKQVELNLTLTIEQLHQALVSQEYDDTVLQLIYNLLQQKEEIMFICQKSYQLGIHHLLISMIGPQDMHNQIGLMKTISFINEMLIVNPGLGYELTGAIDKLMSILLHEDSNPPQIVASLTLITNFILDHNSLVSYFIKSPHSFTQIQQRIEQYSTYSLLDTFLQLLYIVITTLEALGLEHSIPKLAHLLYSIEFMFTAEQFREQNLYRLCKVFSILIRDMSMEEIQRWATGTTYPLILNCLLYYSQQVRDDYIKYYIANNNKILLTMIPSLHTKWVKLMIKQGLINSIQLLIKDKSHKLQKKGLNIIKEIVEIRDQPITLEIIGSPIISELIEIYQSGAQEAVLKILAVIFEDRKTVITQPLINTNTFQLFQQIFHDEKSVELVQSALDILANVAITDESEAWIKQITLMLDINGITPYLLVFQNHKDDQIGTLATILLQLLGIV